MGLLPRVTPLPRRRHPVVAETTPPRRLRATCQAFSSRGRRPLLPEKAREREGAGWVPAEAEAGSSGEGPRRAPPPLGALVAPGSLDRLIDVVMSRSPGPGLKSRQARDGRSWRTGPLFSFCPRAPRLSCHALPACRGVCGRQGWWSPALTCGLPPPASRRGRGRGPRTQQTPSLRLLGVCLPGGPPRVGGGRPAAAPRARCRRVSVTCSVLCGAPGALQVVPQAREAERWCRSFSPACSSGSPPRWCVP